MPVVAQAPAKPFPPRSTQRLRSEMGRHRARLAELGRQSTFCADLRAESGDDRPSAWPTEISELADKITREANGLLGPFEAPVRGRDRQMIVKALPPGILVERNDPQTTAGRRLGDPCYR